MVIDKDMQQRKSVIRPDQMRQIDENLKRLYADQARQPLPDDLTQLLARLAAQEKPQQPDQHDN